MSLINLPEDMSEIIYFQENTDIYNIQFLNSTGSTNDAGKEIAKKGNANGVVIIADSQTDGRGRIERKWFSPKGVNIYMSIIRTLNRDIDETFISGLNLAVSEGICSAIVKVASLEAYPRLPNDIYYNNKKLGGVLIESLICGQAIRYIVVGIGINVNVERGGFPPDIADRATSIYIETGKGLKRGTLICAILIELHRYMTNII
jgi:BirA family biotin operon repressor/biotin-[acetyl-CoA-carboxylase] ligase